jgi:hypothetical protein
MIILLFKITNTFDNDGTQNKHPTKDGAQSRIFCQYDHSYDDSINRLDTTYDTGSANGKVSKTVDEQSVTHCGGKYSKN